MTVHIQVWAGSQSARITDMTNAYRVGKKCRVLRVNGVCFSYSSTEAAPVAAARRATVHIMATLQAFNSGEAFDAVKLWVSNEIDAARAAGAPESYLSMHDEEIKGIHAPRETLSAGVEGQWSATADASGISLRQNDVNQWSEITPSSQSAAKAYTIAAKVWANVQASRTMREAADVLRSAGAQLHGYCAMD